MATAARGRRLYPAGGRPVRPADPGRVQPACRQCVRAMKDGPSRRERALRQDPAL